MPVQCGSFVIIPLQTLRSVCQFSVAVLLLHPYRHIDWYSSSVWQFCYYTPTDPSMSVPVQCGSFVIIPLQTHRSVCQFSVAVLLLYPYRPIDQYASSVWQFCYYTPTDPSISMPVQCGSFVIIPLQTHRSVCQFSVGRNDKIVISLYSIKLRAGSPSLTIAVITA